MSDLKDLNRAVQSAVFPGHHWAQAVREWIGAATERMEGGGGISVECVEADSGYLCTKLAGHEGEHLALGLANGERHHWPKKPASEGGKVEYLCPYCGVATDGPTHLRKLEHGAEWTCNRRCSNCHAPSGDHELCERCESILKRKPAQPDTSTVDVGMQCLGCGDTEPTCRCEGYSPEPVAEEMPEAVSVNTWQLEELLKYADLAEVSLRTGFHPPEFLFEPADRSLRQCIDAIKEQRDLWRTHAAQPAPAVAMTEELEKVLNFAAIRHKDANTDTRILWDPEYLVAVGKAIAAVRSQAAEAGIKLPKVRAFLENSEPDAYLDAAEGRK